MVSLGVSKIFLSVLKITIEYITLFVHVDDQSLRGEDGYTDVKKKNKSHRGEYGY
jgi:hypothetical protein